MGFLEQIQTTISDLLKQPYAKHLLFFLLVVVAFYMFRNRIGQHGGAVNGADDTSESETETEQHSPDVTDHSQEKQDQTVPPTAVVLFYSNLCGHCQVLMPTWDQLTSKYRGNQMVMLDKVDCAEDRAAGEQFKIEAYPTILKLRQDGSREEYQGDRDSNSLEEFIKS